MKQLEQLYRNNHSIYNIMFYNVYYGIIGKQCFTPRWRCVSYMEFAPLAPPLYFGIQPIPRSCKRSSTLRSESGNRTYSITAKTDDLRARFKVPEWGVFCHSARLRNRPARLKLVLSDSAALSAPPQWVIICGRYNYTLPASTGFDLTVPLRG